MAAATAKGDEFGREGRGARRPRPNLLQVNEQKKQLKKTMKKAATGKVKRAIKRTVRADTPSKVAKRDVEILASAGLAVRASKRR